MLALTLAMLALLTTDQTLDDGRLNSDVFAHPQWAVRPALRYPAAASQEGVVSGVVVVRCEVGHGGRPKGCEAVSEMPADLGFGQAAVEGVEAGLLAPEWAKNWSKGMRFTLRVRFLLDEK